RGDDHLGEDLGDLLGHLDAHLAVGGDDATEGRDRVALVRVAVRGGDVVGDRDAARVGVLDDRDARLAVVVRGTPGGVGVLVVVVGHLLAVELLGLREPRLAGLVHVQGCGLVRVLAVAKDIRAGPGRAGPRRELRLVALGRRVTAVHPARDGDVVGGSVLERLRGKTLALLEGETATLDGGEHITVGGRVDDDRDGRVVLRRGTHHRRATDVDLLDAL